MRSGNNEEESLGNIPSIRLKYKGGKNGKSKINYGVVKESSKREISSGGGIKEEKIVITKESKSSRGIAQIPLETSSKITTKTVVQGGDTGKSSQKITITKTEITEQSKSSRAVSGQKDGKGSIISKTTEKTITSGDNRNRSRGREVKDEITTQTTTTTTNQGGRGRSSGKEEVVKTVTSTTTENTSTQRRVRGGNQAKGAHEEEITKTETTTTTTNQRQRGRGESQGKKEQVVKEVTTSTSVNRRNADNQKQVTTTKTVTTASVGQNSASKSRETKAASLAPSQTTQIKVEETRTGRNGRNGQNATTNQKSLIAQKSVPALRDSKEVKTKTTIKEEVKRPYSSKTEIDRTRDNITRITIDDTGKIPKKTYVLNVRKLDRIQQNKRQRLTYSSNLEKNNPITTGFNHNIIIIKNVKELPANSSPKKNIPNTVEKIINESGKIQITQRAVSPRKNEIIKSYKKPLKLIYENYVETNTTTSLKSGIKQIPLPPSIKKTEIAKVNTGDRNGSKTTETKTSRIRTEGAGNKTTTTTTTTTTETKTRLGRNKSEANVNKGGEKASEVTVTKTEISMESKGGKGGRLKISRSGRNISENSGSTTEKKTIVEESSRGRGGKVETVTTKEVITQRSGSKNREGGEGSKITTVKKTEISTSSTGENGGRSRSRVKQETSSTTTTTETKTVTKTSSKVEPREGGGVVKKFRSMRHMKK